MAEQRPIIKIEIDSELAKVIRLFGAFVFIIAVIALLVLGT